MGNSSGVPIAQNHSNQKVIYPKKKSQFKKQEIHGLDEKERNFFEFVGFLNNCENRKKQKLNAKVLGNFAIIVKRGTNKEEKSLFIFIFLMIFLKKIS